MRLSYTRTGLITNVETVIHRLETARQLSEKAEAIEAKLKAKYEEELRKYASDILEMHVHKKDTSIKIEVAAEHWNGNTKMLHISLKPAAGIPVKFAEGFKDKNTLPSVASIDKKIQEAKDILTTLVKANDKNVIITTNYDLEKMKPYLQ
jgi:diacylglycerol kinase family enzyme